jgi:GntR family transcriptional regulator
VRRPVTRPLTQLQVRDDMRARVNRRSPERMADQLARVLADGIRKQGLRVGDPLPGEHELCRDFSVSRTVVRQALGQLQQRGVLQRHKGKGTFVGDGKTGETFVYSLRGLFEEVTSRGGLVHSDVLQLGWDKADPEVAAALDCRTQSKVVTIGRLRYVDGEPWCWTRTWLRADLAPVVLHADLAGRSLYRLLAEAGVQLIGGRRSVEAAIAEPELAARLSITDNPAVMILKSMTFDRTLRPVEYYVAHHRGDRSRFEFELAAQNAPMTS